MALRKKYIGADQIDQSKILLEGALRAKDSAGAAQELLKLDGDIFKLIKMPHLEADPTSANHLVRKSFLDGKVTVIEGLISAETSARIAAISAEESARISAISAEQSARIAAVSAEESARIAAVSAEQSARIAAVSAEEAARIAAISAEQLARESADNALDARLDIVEPKVSTLEGKVAVVEKDLSTEQAIVFENLAGVYADGRPGSQDPQYREGWYFKNASAGQKINWYFYDGQVENVSLGDMKSVYAIVTMDSVASLPIMAIYTTPTGSGDAQSWYKSRKTYTAPSGLLAGKKYLLYIGEAPAVHPELPKVQMVISTQSTEGPQNAAERVMTMAFNSNSGAAVNNVQFLVESLGFESPAIRRELLLRIRKASVAELAAETLSRQSADSAEQSLRASEILRIEGLVSAEQSARVLADNGLDARLDILEPKVSTLESEMDAVEGRASALETDMGILKGNSSQAGSVDYKVKAAVDSIVAGAPALYDTLLEVSQYITSDQSAGAAMLSQLNDHEQRLDTLEGAKTVVGSVAYAVEQEKVRAMAAESAIQGEVDAEELLRASEITRVEGLITSEQNARISGDNALDARLDVLESDKTVSGSVAYAVEQEKIRAMAAESAEQSARVSGDNALDARLDVLESDSSVQGSVAYAVAQEAAIRASADSAEVTARQNADASLQSQITAEITNRTNADALLANKQLSNLGTTSINAEILPDGNGTRNIGSTTLNWNTIHARTQFLNTPTGVQAAHLGANFTTPSALTGASGISLLSGASGVLALMTVNNTSATKAIRLETGNATAANFNSGDIALQTGTVSGTGVRGKVILSGSSIEPQTSVIPNVNALYDLGLGTMRFRNLYVSASVSLSNGSIGNNIQTPSNVSSLGMTASNIPVSVFTGSKASGFGSSVDVLIESGNSADAASGSIKLRTGTAGTTRGKVEVAALSLDMGSAKIESLAAGVASTDAVNKGQLDAGVTEAKGYTDTKVAALVASAPAVLDTLNELAAALGNDPSFATTVAGQIGALDTRLDTLEGADTVVGSVAKAKKDAVAEAKTYTDAQLDSLAIPSYQFEKITLSSQDVANGYIDVQAPIVGMCLISSYNVLASRGSDFSFSGQRITFSGEWAVGGLSAIEVGQEVEVHYFKTIYPFA